VRGGNRVGAIVSTGEKTVRIPARGGTAHARYLMRAIAQLPRAAEGQRGDLAAMLEQLRRPPRKRGLVAIVSDFLCDTDWERPLRGLSGRHQLIAAEVIDPRELELPAAGLMTFVDPESGDQLEVQTSSADLRKRYAAAAAKQRAQIATMLRHAGAGHLQLRTDRDWLTDVVKFVIARRKTLSGSGVVR
jgi:uncharacterized protein (DUF58 family)